MRTCLTLHNRPQECYNSELNSSWLFTLIAIFAGCICLTVTIVLMIVSHWDRTVAPYAKWIGFSAGKLNNISWCYWKGEFPEYILTTLTILPPSHGIEYYELLFVLFFFSNIVLLGVNCFSNRIFRGWDRRCSLSASKQFSSWTVVYFLCHGSVDYGYIWTVCFQSVSPTFLKTRTMCLCSFSYIHAYMS